MAKSINPGTKIQLWKYMLSTKVGLLSYKICIAIVAQAGCPHLNLDKHYSPRRRQWGIGAFQVSLFTIGISILQFTSILISLIIHEDYSSSFALIILLKYMEMETRLLMLVEYFTLPYIFGSSSCFSNRSFQILRCFLELLECLNYRGRRSNQQKIANNTPCFNGHPLFLSFGTVKNITAIAHWM